MKTIGIDIDDVIAEFVPYFIHMYNKKYKTKFKLSDIHSYCLSEELGTIQRRIDDEIFGMQVRGEYKKLIPYPDASKYISLLKKKGHKIILITTRVCAHDTVEWLKENKIPYDNLFTIKSKQYILGELGLDYFIDDNIDNVTYAEYFKIKPILFNQPWNTNCVRKNVMKANDWREIYNIIG